MKKRILSILLVACMLLAVIPMTVSAETINTPTTAATGAPQYEGVQNTAKYYKTVYISAEGNDANNGSQAAPVATLSQAFTLLGTMGGEIVVLDDVTELTMNYTDYSGGGAKIARFGNEGLTSPVYIHGVKKSGSDDYTSIMFDTTGDTKNNGKGRQILHIAFNGPVEIYNIELKINMEIFFFSTLGHEFTIGENVKTTALTTATSITGKFNICGGKQNTGIGGTINVASPAVTNVFAGTWDRIFSVSVNPGSNTEQRAGTVNIYGGTITTVYTKFNHNNVAAINGELTVNYYGGTVGTIAAYGTATHTVNLYGTTKSGSGITFTEQFADGGTGVINENVAGTAAAFDSTIAPNLYSVRFVATFTGEISAYDKVGFKVTVGTDDYSKECAKVYTSVAGDSASITAAALGGDYIFALAIKDIPTSAGEVTFTVTPYTVAAGQTDEVLGTAYTVTYNAGVYSAN